MDCQNKTSEVINLDLVHDFHHVKVISDYPLLNEINERNNHLCIHSKNGCPFCFNKLKIKVEPFSKQNGRHFLPSEVVLHNTPEDCWVSILGKVFNITPIIEKHRYSKSIKPLLAFAGKDISNWFNEVGDIQHYVHPVTGVYLPYCPFGNLPDVHCQVPATGWEPLQEAPWWKNEQFVVGYLTKKARKIKIRNMLTSDVCLLEVCMEDDIKRIQQRYRLFNSDEDSYTWCFDDRALNLNRTLEENGIPDERDRFVAIGLPEDTYIPTILLYYNDDFKWELP